MNAYGRRIETFGELDSTNAHALRHFADLTDGTVIMALRQTAGHGRLSRVWLSEGKGLYFTIIVRPDNQDGLFYANLTQFLSVCVCASLSGMGLSPSIKWPNDILCAGGKICGILAEAAADANGIYGAALGAGINILQTPQDFRGLLYPASSLAMLMQNPPEHTVLLNEVLRQFDLRYPAYLKHGFASIKTEYCQYFAFAGEPVRWASGTQVLEGLAEGVDEQGHLLLRCDGTLHHLTARFYTKTARDTSAGRLF